MNECMSHLNARQYMDGYTFEDCNEVFGCLSSVLVTSGSWAFPVCFQDSFPMLIFLLNY